MPTATEPEYTLSEAGALIGRSSSTLRNQIHRGRLKARLVGKTYVVSRGELFRYVGSTQPELDVPTTQREDK